MLNMNFTAESVPDLARQLHEASLEMGFVPNQAKLEAKPDKAEPKAEAKPEAKPEPKTEPESKAEPDEKPKPKKRGRKKSKVPTAEACVEAMKGFVLNHPSNDAPGNPSAEAKAAGREVLNLFSVSMTQELKEEQRQEFLDTIEARSGGPDEDAGKDEDEGLY